MAQATILTLKQTKRGTEVFAEAAQLLLGRCPGQSAARAYYQVHIVAQQIALVFGPPFESVRSDGQPIGRLLHADLPRTVFSMCTRQIERGRTTTPDAREVDSYDMALALLKARMEADYRPHEGFSNERARRLLLYAVTLTGMLMVELELIHNAPRGGKLPTRW